MTRNTRIIYEGAIYHIYQRGNNKEFIFKSNKIKRYIFNLLDECSKKYDYELLAYVIMNNHYHFLLKANKTSTSEIMFTFNNKLGKYVNKNLHRTGHVFQDRYKCKLVEKDDYLLWLLRYIHRNPVRAHICTEVKEYKWSSHKIYLSNRSAIVNTEFIMSMLGETRKTALTQYMKLVNTSEKYDNSKKDYEEIMKEISFTKRINANCDVINANFKEVAPKIKRNNLDEIIKELNINEEELFYIKGHKKSACLTPIKLNIIRKAIQECFSFREIADYLNMDPSSISKIISRNNLS